MTTATPTPTKSTPPSTSLTLTAAEVRVARQSVGFLQDQCVYFEDGDEAVAAGLWHKLHDAERSPVAAGAGPTVEQLQKIVRELRAVLHSFPSCLEDLMGRDFCAEMAGALGETYEE